MAIRILFANNNYASLDCDVCKFNVYCIKGCYGSQYEANKDPFTTIPNICDFYKQKYTFILKKLESLGVFDECKNVFEYEEHYERVNIAYNLFKEVTNNGLGKCEPDIPWTVDSIT